MKKDDAAHWKQRYSNSLDGPPDLRLAKFTGLPLENVVALGDEILADLSPAIYGVGWWQHHLPARERVLISDHLLACTRAISHNILEAQAGLLAYREATADFDALLQRGCKSGGEWEHPAPRGPWDDLVGIREDAALAAIVRALGSALDCLGGATVGVCGLPANIVRADLTTARKTLGKVAEADPHGLSAAMLRVFTDAITKAGPTGWLSWLTELRNTIVHRGRRVTTISQTVIDRGRKVEPLLESVRVLPSSPGATEVDSWAKTGGYFGSLLREPADTTLNGVLRSTVVTVDAVCAELRRVWARRREDQELIRQPAAQWKDEQTVAPFSGYEPDSTLMADATALAVADELLRRLQAAAWAPKPDPAVWSAEIQ